MGKVMGVAAIALAAMAVPAPAQNGQTNRVADSAAGRAGQRQGRLQAIGTVPIARVNGRIQNRVQTRLRNRIDRNYDPQANAAAPFERAEERVRRPGPR